MSISNLGGNLVPGDRFPSCAKIGLGSCSVLCEHVTPEQFSVFFFFA